MPAADRDSRKLRYMRAPALALIVLGLAACQPTVPQTTSGVGFQDYNSYVRQREAALVGGGAAPVAPYAAAPAAPLAPQGGFSTDRAAAAIAAAEGTGAPLGATAPLTAAPAPLATAAVTPLQPIAPATGVRPRGGAPAGIREESGEVTNSGISDEQDFNAVASRETIESDAERIARNRAQYQVIQPGALPQRSGDTGPNIVQFALSTSHDPGQAVYKRSAIRTSSANAACAKFASPDLAQQAFLERGGPERDRMGVDPDGDGFACSWDPRPFRTALR